MKTIWKTALAASAVAAAGVAIVAGLAASPAAAQAALAVNDRVASGTLKGTVVRIGGDGDPAYYRGCYAVHFDYAHYDPAAVQWTCPNVPGNVLVKLGAGDQPAAPGPAPRAAPAAILDAAPMAGAPAGQPHACFASDPDAGASARERTFRGLVRQTLEHAAAPGMDGAVTVRFTSFKVGGPRAWQVADGFNFASNQRSPVYGLRVAYVTCQDFRTEIQLRTQERNYECFTAPTGVASCQVSGSTGGLARDTSQYIQK